MVDAVPALVFTCGGHAERVADVAEKAGIHVHRAIDAASAAFLCAPLIEPSDLVLVKGSRGVATEVVVEAILARGRQIEDGAKERPETRPSPVSVPGKGSV